MQHSYSSLFTKSTYTHCRWHNDATTFHFIIILCLCFNYSRGFSKIFHTQTKSNFHRLPFFVYMFIRKYFITHWNGMPTSSHNTTTNTENDIYFLLDVCLSFISNAHMFRRCQWSKMRMATLQPNTNTLSANRQTDKYQTEHMIMKFLLS